jgi:hypothetical protein
MRAGYRFVLVAALGAICSLASVRVSSAQYLSYRADQLGVSIDPAARGVRLLSLGAMRFVIPDENNEINLADFGQNLSGVATDKDGWSVESWFSRRRMTEDFPANYRGAPVIQRDTFNSEVAHTRVIYRNGNGRAIGGSFQWTGHSTVLRYGDQTKTRGPQFEAFWNETFGDLSLALGASRWTDEETLSSIDVFTVHHASDAVGWTLGASYPLLGLEWGGQLTSERVRIDGTSVDPSGFHQDDFEWLRPTRKLRLSAFLPEGGDLEFGANFSNFSLDGAEDAQISWSDRFPGNPSGFDFDREVPTFEEEERGSRVEARALYWLGYAPRVAAFAARETRISDVVESSNFIGSRRQGKLDRTRTEVGGGLATSVLEERLTVGVEGLGVLTTDEIVDRVGTPSQVKSRDVSGRLGVEWFTRQDFALRAGYERLVLDADTDAPLTLQTGQAASFGFGWVPKGALYVVDGMFRYVDRTPDQDGGRERDSFELALYGRLLF